MVYIPTREQLYELVKARFRELHPSAPTRLSATSAADAEWRAEWMRVRDDVLGDEVNRIYWEQNHDAPHKIDPSNPDHDRFERAWLHIREQILSNQPDPAQADDTGVDMSYVRAAVHETLEQRLRLIHDDLHEDMRRFATYALEQIEQHARSIGGGQIWSLPSAIYESREHVSHRVDASADAWWDANTGALAGNINLVVTEPVSS